MHPFRQSFLNHTATATAHLRCVGRVNQFYRATSLYSFVAQQTLEDTQPGVVSAEGELVVEQHELEFKVFKRNQSVGVDQPEREFVPEVFALLGHMLMQTCHLKRGFTAALTALFAAAQTPLGATKFTQRVSQPARVVDQRLVGEGQQTQQSHIATDSGQSVGRKNPIGQLQHQVHEPLAVLALDEHMLDDRILRQSAMKLDFDVRDVLDVQHRRLARSRCELAAIAVGVLDAGEALRGFEAWMSRRFTRLDPAKKRAVSLIQSSQEVLQTAGVEQDTGLFAPLSEVGPLTQACCVLTRCFVAGFRLRQRPIVNLAPLLQQFVKGLRFGLAREQTILVGQIHRLATLLVVNVATNCFCRNITRRTNIVRVCPQARQATFQMWELFPQLESRCTLQPVHDLRNRNCGWEGRKQMNVVRLDNQFQNTPAQLFHLLRNKLGETFANIASQNRAAKLWTPHKVVVDGVVGMSCLFSHHKRILSHVSFAYNHSFNQKGEFGFPTRF